MDLIVGLAVALVIGYGLGYGVREWKSRKRRHRRRHAYRNFDFEPAKKDTSQRSESLERDMNDREYAGQDDGPPASRL